MKKKLRFSYLAFLEQLILVSILLTEVHIQSEIAQSQNLHNRLWLIFTKRYA